MAEVKAFNLDTMPADAGRDFLFNLLALLAGKTRLLCIGASSLSLAQRLAQEGPHEVTLLVDPRDYLDPEHVQPVKLVIESLTSADLAKRFRHDQFDAVLLADPPQEQGSLKNQLGELMAHFRNALVISLPEALTREKSLLRQQETEIKRLQALLRTRDETISWYSKRLREHLVNHYILEKTHKERVQFEHDFGTRLASSEMRVSELTRECEILRGERDYYESRVEQLSRFSTDTLPKFIRFPLKALIAVLLRGPFEPIRILRKKKVPE